MLDKRETQLSTGLVSAKRSSTERRSIHAWHPYYAGYSETFVASALQHLGADESTLVLDPWGGSGTTGAVATRMGVPSLLSDINPVMATFSAAKSLEVVRAAPDIEDFFARLATHVSSGIECQPDDALLDIFESETARALRSVIEAIPFNGHKFGSDDVEGPAALAVHDMTHIIDPSYAFCMAVVFVTIREVSGMKTAANPTWLKAAEKKAKRPAEELFDDLSRNAGAMLSDLCRFFQGKNAAVPSYVLAGDARKLLVKSRTVDCVVTSPPYLTRIDYALSTAPEMAAFGGGELLTYVRHQTMGAPVITRNGRYQKPEWGVLCNSLLDAVKSHPTKAAESYYWKNIAQYFMDLDAALGEIARVLKPGGKGIIVVQSSYFKEVNIPLGGIYIEMATFHGLRANIAFREEVKGHIAHVNTKSSLYKRSKTYHEEFVYIESP